MKKHRRPKKTFIQKYGYIFVGLLVIISMFIAGMLVGLSWANYLKDKPDLNPTENVIAHLMVTSDDSWNGEIRR